MHAMLADMVLILHAAFIAFVVFGLLGIVLAALLRWRWAGNPWFRGAHLAAIGLVVGQAWLDVACPLTVWESSLRRSAGQQEYEVGFVADWLQWFIFFEAEPWVFTLAYTLFGALVVLTLWLAPVRWRELCVGRFAPAARTAAEKSSHAP